MHEEGFRGSLILFEIFSNEVQQIQQRYNLVK